LPAFVSKDGGNILANILNTDPETRYTAEDIRKDRWFKLYQPICMNEGLIIGKNHIPAEPKILEMIEQFGYKPDFAEKCINNNKHNQVTTIYYLIHKRYEKQGLLPSHFNIHKENEIKEEQLIPPP
jgi:5'-AMP-activated protein kinase catalytic alpha subunit